MYEGVVNISIVVYARQLVLNLDTYMSVGILAILYFFIHTPHRVYRVSIPNKYSSGESTNNHYQ